MAGEEITSLKSEQSSQAGGFVTEVKSAVMEDNRDPNGINDHLQVVLCLPGFLSTGGCISGAQFALVCVPARHHSYVDFDQSS